MHPVAMAALASAMAITITQKKMQHLSWNLRESELRDQVGVLRGYHVAAITCTAVGYNKSGRTSEEESLRILLDRMKPTIHDTDTETYIRILRVCTKFKALQEGRRLHSYIRESGKEQERLVGNHLVEMYLKCGSLRDAQRIFDEMESRDAILWTSMISAYSERGHFRAALKLFQRMQQAGDVKPDNVTYITVLNCCGRLGSLEDGKLVHSQLRNSGFESDTVVNTALLNMYGNCGSLSSAREVFSIKAGDVVTWNAMMGVYVQHEAYREALELFQAMDCEPNVSTFVTLLNACGGAMAIEEGREVHSRVIKSSMEWNEAVSNALFHMYGKCGSLEDARGVFLQFLRQDRACWAHMISFYLHQDRCYEAVRLFHVMLQEGVGVDRFTFTTVLSVCNGVEFLKFGRLLHSCIVECAYESDVVVRSALVHMYGRCGSYEDSRGLFEGFQTKNALLSSAMIATSARYEKWREVIEIFKQVKSVPYKLTVLNVLKACTEIQALADGRAIHSQVKDRDLYDDIEIREGLMNMYCKCKSFENARALLDETHDKGPSLWNTLVAACAQDGKTTEALEFFERMQLEEIEPDENTIASILSVDEGYQFLKSLPKDARLAESCRRAGLQEEDGNMVTESKDCLPALHSDSHSVVSSLTVC